MIKNVLLFAFALLFMSSCARAEEEFALYEPIYLPRSEIIIETKAGQDYTFDVELARTPAEHARGLMYRKHLNSDSGMLFLFPGEDRPAFWMKNTLIPLDIIFVSHDGLINHIHHNAKPQDETKITTDYPTFAVLELNSGVTDSLSIKTGDKIIHPVFRNVLAPQ